MNVIILYCLVLSIRFTAFGDVSERGVYSVKKSWSIGLLHTFGQADFTGQLGPFPFRKRDEINNDDK